MDKEVQMKRNVYGMIELQLILLFITLIFGTFLSIFVYGTGNPNSPIFSLPSGLVIAIHAVLGVAIIINGLLIISKSFELKNHHIRYASIIALAFLLLAFVGGLGFLFANALGVFSFIMAMGFLLSLGTYMIPFGFLRELPRHKGRGFLGH